MPGPVLHQGRQGDGGRTGEERIDRDGPGRRTCSCSTRRPASAAPARRSAADGTVPVVLPGRRRPGRVGGGDADVRHLTATAGPGGPVQLDYANEYTFKTFRWDPVKGKVLGEWTSPATGCEPPRHYGPSRVAVGTQMPDPTTQPEARGRRRCGASRWPTASWPTSGRPASAGSSRPGAGELPAHRPVRQQVGHHAAHTMSYPPQSPIAYDAVGAAEPPGRPRLRVGHSRRRPSWARPGGTYCVCRTTGRSRSSSRSS